MESSIFVLEPSGLTYKDIKSFCSQGLSEGLRIEYKRAFPRNLKLAETVCAFANTQGGVILIGVEADKETNRPVATPGIELKEGLEEKVTNVCLSHISPTITPEVKACDFKSDPKKGVSDRAVLFIRVRPSYSAPHYLLNDNKIPVRVHNRNSMADLPNIERLIGRRERILSERFVSNVSYDKKEINVENEAFETVVVAPQFPPEPFIHFYTKEDSQWLSETVNGVMRLNEQIPGIYQLIHVNSLDNRKRYCSVERTGRISFQRRATVEKDILCSGMSIILMVDALRAAQKIYSRFGFHLDISVGLTIDNAKNLKLGLLPDDSQRRSRYLDEFRCDRNRVYVSKTLRYDELSNLNKKMTEVLRELCVQFHALFPEKTIENWVREVIQSLKPKDVKKAEFG